MGWVYNMAIGDLNWFSTITFILFPIVSVAMLILVKRKFLWAAPIVSTVLSIGFAAMVEPSMLTYGEYRSMFFGLVIPMQLIVAVILTVAAYIAGRFLKRARGN